MNFIEGLNWRLATKTFDPTRKVSESDLMELLEALRLTPSSFGLQPWKFIVVESPIVKSALLPVAFGQRQVIEASHVLVLCQISELTQNYIHSYIERVAQEKKIEISTLAGFEMRIRGFLDQKSASEQDAWLRSQLYIALGFLMFAAAQKQIDACPMEGFDSVECDRILGLDAMGLRSVLLCPIGFRVQDMPITPKVRFDLDELVIRVL